VGTHSRERGTRPELSSSNLAQMAKRREGALRRAVVVPALGVLALLVASCANATPASGPSPSGIGPGKGYGGTVTVGPQDAGKTVTLGAGDILVFAAPTSSPSPSASAWRLVSYPTNLITLLSRSSTPPFRFRALHPGTGLLELSVGPRCGSPGPLKGDSMQCPVAGAMNEGAGIPERLITFPLHVLARG
jgi:hypothetical protein